MKKIILILILIFAIYIIISLFVAYTNYKSDLRQFEQENREYEQYYNKEILGSDIATVINKAIDSNEKNEVPKDENNLYIENDTNSIKIEIKLIGETEENIYPMERIYNLQIEEFMKHFNTAKFKCTTIEYHEKTKRIKYLLFEEI